MSVRDTERRAIERLEVQLTDLAGIRNATPRDPGFKNWRQSTLTVLQRIWPEEVDRFERFRRIPFSPPDPSADSRTLREWYSRGCGEAAGVLRAYIEEIQAKGVPESSGQMSSPAQEAGFADDFPTVDLPAGDLGASTSTADMTENMLAELGDTPPQGSVPASRGPAQLQVGIPPAPAPALILPVAGPEPRTPKKGLNVKARLRELLGFAQLSAKALAGFPRELGTPDRPAAGARADLRVVPLGAGLTAAPSQAPPRLAPAPSPSRSWPMLQRPASAPVGSATAPGLPATAVTPVAAVPVWPAPPAPAVEAPQAMPTTGPEPAAATPSGLLSRSTTLRASIEKVSIDSLIDPAFRTGHGGEAPAAAAPDASGTSSSATDASATDSSVGPRPAPGAAPAPDAVDDAASQPPRPGRRPVLRLVPPVFDDPEFSVEPGPSTEPETPPNADAQATPTPVAAPEPPRAAHAPASRIVPLPILHTPRAPHPEPPSEPAPGAEFDAEPSPGPSSKVDPEEFARMTDDFLRSSPVLGATGRRVQRGFDEPSFGDADAIAVGAMVQDLARMGVPPERQPEVRARLLELARRFERGELEWGALRKAVWFAMEYPELARRIMPVLLPWIDRAA